jgi:hypothetical protein
MVYGKWLDFYMHIVWQSRSNGVLEIWYRKAGQRKFTKLYSDVPGDKALIRVRPHPTLLYNTQNGAPGENGKPGLLLEGGFYRANTTWTSKYWWDGMRRRRSRAALLAGFPHPTLHRRRRTRRLEQSLTASGTPVSIWLPGAQPTHPAGQRHHRAEPTAGEHSGELSSSQ